MREDLTMAKRQHHLARLQAERAAEAAAAAAATAATATSAADADGMTSSQASGTEQAMALPSQPSVPVPGAPNFPAGVHPSAMNGPRQPWEHVEEIMSILKTAFPLLALSMEMIVDQVASRFKPGPDEDIYRLVSALLSDSLQVRSFLVITATATADPFFGPLGSAIRRSRDYADRRRSPVFSYNIEYCSLRR